MKPVPAAEVAAHLGAFERRCREHGLALTHQRRVIYREMLLMGGHPSPESVYERVRRQIPSISLGTVYKNVRIFLDAGLLRELSLHHGSLRLEASGEPHHHLVCTACRKVFDLPEKDLAPVKLRGTAPEGFRIQRISVEFLGLCALCAKPGARRPASLSPSQE
jgi:Fur family peroxide stress response transcriptional regulator